MDEASMRLWLVRHGETASNAGGVFQGHLDVALNGRGEEQARSVGEALRDVSFSAVYASDLQRAARTAELIVGERHPVILDPDLREMHYGVLQGVSYRDAADVLEPHGLADAWLSGDIHRGRYCLPEGESLRQFRNRSARFVKRVDEEYLDDADANVLVVAHGGQLAVLLTVLLGMRARDRFSFRFGNCSITLLSRTALNTTLDVHNYIVWGDDATMFSDRGLSGQLPQRAE
jgi:broad specificity phosphatase PhoE